MNQKKKNDMALKTQLEKEKEQLLKQLEETAMEVADVQDMKVDELTNEIEELKQKMSK